VRITRDVNNIRLFTKALFVELKSSSKTWKNIVHLAITVPAKKIFTLTEYFYKEFKRKDFTIYVFYSALNQYFVISPFELMTI